MISSHGTVRHFIRVLIRQEKEKNKIVDKKFTRDLLVESPIETKQNLMVSIDGSAEKSVLLHLGGIVRMHASIGRKGFAPGETITVHISVDNRLTHTSTSVTPRIHLYQVQIFMSEIRHKTIEKELNIEPIIGKAIAPSENNNKHVKDADNEQLLDVMIPLNESLTIKSELITVKYFVRVTLDIPNSFDLHISLPIVVTSDKILEQLKTTTNETKTVKTNK